MSRFISKRFAQMVPYRLGEQPKNMEFIKLNSNETLIPPSEGVMILATSGQRSYNIRTSIPEISGHGFL